MRMKFWLAAYTSSLFFLFSATSVSAQTDTNIVKQPEPAAQRIVVRQRYNPRKATLMAAALPGLGQIYTKKYWKLPLLYGGAGVLGYFIGDNNRKYIIWRDRYISQRTASESKLELPFKYPNTDTPVPLDQLKRAKDYYRRNRDFSIILSGVLYALNILDANVTAHLKDFDLSEDLSMSVEPVLNQNGAMPVTGVSLTFHLR